jgi:hypothetical protein
MKKTTPLLARAYLDDLTVRTIDKEKRQATFVAATEGGVLTWGGKEFLRMSGVNLKRFRRNSVVLDTHERGSAGAVIGKGEVWVDGRELMITVTFAETARAEEIWSLVQGGFLRAVSVGFLPGLTKKLADGEEDVEQREGKPDDKSRVKGPATIIKTWELYEVSVVPVPADSDAVRRELGAWLKEYGADLSEEARDDSNQTDKEIVMKELFAKWAKARGLSLDGIDEKKRAELEAQCERELGAGLDKKPETQDAPPAAPKAEDKPAERSLAVQLRELAPRHLDPKAVDEAVLAATDLADGKKRLLELMAKVQAPAGTTEPNTTDEKKPEVKSPEAVRSELSDLLKRGIAD